MRARPEQGTPEGRSGRFGLILGWSRFTSRVSRFSVSGKMYILRAHTNCTLNLGNRSHSVLCATGFGWCGVRQLWWVAGMQKGGTVWRA